MYASPEVSVYEESTVCIMYIYCRKVVVYGTYVKHLKVKVYLFELKLCVHPHVNNVKLHKCSRADTVG